MLEQERREFNEAREGYQQIEWQIQQLEEEKAAHDEQSSALEKAQKEFESRCATLLGELEAQQVEIDRQRQDLEQRCSQFEQLQQSSDAADTSSQESGTESEDWIAEAGIPVDEANHPVTTPTYEDANQQTSADHVTNADQRAKTQSDPSPTFKTTESENEHDSDASDVDAYVARLLKRVGGNTASSSSQTEEEPPAKKQESRRDDQTGEVRPRPRRSAPEQQTDIDAMRDLANMSARLAIETNHKSRLATKTIGKLLVAALSLTMGLLILNISYGKSNVGMFGALIGIIAAMLWLVQAMLIWSRGRRYFHDTGTSEKARPKLDLRSEVKTDEPAPVDGPEAE